MVKLKGFFNQILKNNRIFTAEDIGEMSSKEFGENEKAIDYQTSTLGIPYRNDLRDNDDVEFVSGYTRADGTQVKAYYRAKSDSMPNLNPTYNAPTGFAAGVQNNYQADFSSFSKSNPLVNINMQENKNYPNAQEMANIYLVKPENAPKSNEYNYIAPNYGFEHLNGKYNLTGNKSIPEDWPGIVYNWNSSMSKNVSNSQEMQNQIRAQFDNYNNRFSKDKLDISFTQDPNLHRSIAHGTILEPKIDSEGYFTGYMYDKYDFDFMKDYASNPKLTAANNLFALLGLGSNRNYYTIAPVKFKW
jgi:hypothetical protein